MFIAASVGVRGDILYMNATTDTHNVLTFPDSQEIGDEVLVNPALPAEYLTGFSFQYYSPNMTFTGPVQADVRLYKNDGTPLFNGYNPPGTVFYDSGLFNIVTPQQAEGLNAATIVVELSDLLTGVVPLDPYMVMPTDFTLSVTFQGLQGGDSVGVSLYDPATVGSNYGDYWYNNAGSWELRTNNVPVAFGMEFFGSTEPTPEPATFSLGLLGAALVAGGMKWQRRKNAVGKN